MGLKWVTAGACAAVIGILAFAGQPADAQTKKKKRVVTNQSEVVVASRARTRVRVPARSFLDAGTEVLPGERKFMDYALPAGQSPMSFIDNTAFNRRSSLPGPFELPSRQNPWPWNWCVGC